jgi:hypothetical protein
MRQRINPGRMRMWGFHIATSLLPMAGSWLKVLNCAAIRCEAGCRRCSSLQRIDVYCLSLAERRNILNSHINLAKTVTDGYHVASWRRYPTRRPVGFRVILYDSAIGKEFGIRHITQLKVRGSSSGYQKYKVYLLDDAVNVVDIRSMHRDCGVNVPWICTVHVQYSE